MNLDDKSKIIAILGVLTFVFLVSGCIGGQGGGKTLKIQGFSFASEISDNGEYNPHSSVYGPEERVWIYFEVEGVERKNNTVQIKEDLKVTGPDGKVIMDDKVVDTALNMKNKDVLWLKNYITPPAEGFKKGKHEIEINLKDKLSGKTVTFKKEFSVEGEDAGLKSFESGKWSFELEYPSSLSLNVQKNSSSELKAQFIASDAGNVILTATKDPEINLEDWESSLVTQLKEQDFYKGAETSVSDTNYMDGGKIITIENISTQGGVLLKQKILGALREEEGEKTFFTMIFSHLKSSFDSYWNDGFGQVAESFQFN